jgi:hypothetical protein
MFYTAQKAGFYCTYNHLIYNAKQYRAKMRPVTYKATVNFRDNK